MHIFNRKGKFQIFLRKPGEKVRASHIKEGAVKGSFNKSSTFYGKFTGKQ